MLLEQVKSPDDLRRLDPGQLSKLAEEIRSRIITVTSRTGGHVGPSLGAVELAIALHLVFSSPRDAIIWDVGHQSYAHKILTGRGERFASLRQRGGISGFPDRDESEHDPFGTGHASTSISAALGLAKARQLRREGGDVVAVIGDGALTGGLAYEAINHAGQEGTHLIVVLNDNSLSISANVGALARYLSRLRSAPTYLGAKARFKRVLEKLSALQLLEAVERIKGSIKYLLLPGAFFETLGFSYVGPVDGHDIGALQEAFQFARRLPGPVLVHAVTRKGKGYAPAEAAPGLFHGPGPFDAQTGAVAQKPGPSWSEVFGQVACELAEEDGRVVAITAAMSDGTGLGDFARRFPARFFDVGIAEAHAVTFAAGLAAAGLRPLVAVYSTFLQRGYDQLVHDVARQRLPVVFCLDRAGIVGEDGATHQGVYDLAYLRHIPNLAVACPRDGKDLASLLRLALRLEMPFAIRYPKGVVLSLDGVPLGSRGTPKVGLGQGELLKAGDDAVILAVGSMVEASLAAAALLQEEGVRVAVVDARFVKPLDKDLLLEWIVRTGRAVTVEEHTIRGGFGSAVLEMLAEAEVRALVKVLGVPEEFPAHGTRSEWLESYGLTALGIAAAVRSCLGSGTG